MNPYLLTLCWCCQHQRYLHARTGCTEPGCSCILSWVELALYEAKKLQDTPKQ